MSANTLFGKINGDVLASYFEGLKRDANLSPATLNRKRASLRKFFNFATSKNYAATNPLDSTTSNVPLQQYIFHPRSNYQLYKEFIAVGAVISLLLLIGIGINRRTKPAVQRLLTTQNISPPAVAAAPSWIIPIKTALVASGGVKIASPSALLFRIYADNTATTPLWVSSSRKLTPDSDGLITTGLGLAELGDNPIPSDLFFKYETLYVEPTVDQLGKLSRIALPTASRSINSMLLNDVPASTNATANTIPIIDDTGRLLLGADTPTLTASNGRLKIEGQGLTLAASPFSNESITLAPDGEGTVNFRLSAPDGNQLDVRNSNINAGNLIYGHVGNDTTGYNLMDLQSGATPSSRFKVDALGNTTIAGNLDVGNLGTLGDLRVKNNAAISGTLTVGTITTTTGNLALKPADKLDLQTKIINSATANSGRVYIDDTLHVEGGMYSRSIINSGSFDSDTISTIGEARLGDGSTDPVYVAGTLNIGSGITPSYQLQLSADSAAKPTSNTWTIVSDERLKENIQSFTDGLAVLKKINPVSYVLNGKANLPKGTSGIGVIAQQVKDIIPYTIDTFRAKLETSDTTETELLSFNSSALTFVLINAVKELESSLAEAQHTIAQLQSQQPVVSPVTEIRANRGSFGQIIDDLLVERNATIAGTLTATEATFSSLFADEVTTRDGKLSDLIERVKKYLAPQETAADIRTEESSFSGLLAQLQETPVYESSNPPNLPNTETMISWLHDQMAAGITPSSLLINNSLYISGETIDSDETLHIQRFAKAPIKLMDGQLVIDTDGNVFLNKNLRVAGTVSTTTLSPLPQGDLTIDLNKPIFESTASGSFDALLPEEKRTPSRFAQLIIKGVDNSVVATIDASGSATFAGTLAARTGTFNKLIIASPALPAEALAKAGTTETISSNSSTGTATLPKGINRITIESNAITDQSLIYLTPVSSTYNKVLYVAAKKSRYFDVAIDQAINADITFNWWIIN